ncbi:SDR family oxidoreductase [Streptomyces mirabilis]|uniref:SDR family oxidoreductase n=1 Tax=Streptomyces mirabilis TaxID=68239 RepID=UPI003EC03D48
MTTTSIPCDREIVLVSWASKGLSAAGHSAEYAELDVTHPSGVHASAEGALACHRRIDVLVNNAGVMALAPLAALRVAEWHQMIDVNLWGVLHGIAAVLPSMLELRSGHSSPSRPPPPSGSTPRPRCTARPSTRCGPCPRGCTL